MDDHQLRCFAEQFDISKLVSYEEIPRLVSQIKSLPNYLLKDYPKNN